MLPWIFLLKFNLTHAPTICPESRPADLKDRSAFNDHLTIFCYFFLFSQNPLPWQHINQCSMLHGFKRMQGPNWANIPLHWSCMRPPSVNIICIVIEIISTIPKIALVWGLARFHSEKWGLITARKHLELLDVCVGIDGSWWFITPEIGSNNLSAKDWHVSRRLLKPVKR